jgi:hypothetical protein
MLEPQNKSTLIFVFCTIESGPQLELQNDAALQHSFYIRFTRRKTFRYVSFRHKKTRSKTDVSKKRPEFANIIAKQEYF